MSDTDRQWFRRNPDANIRFRGSAPGEAEALLSMLSEQLRAELESQAAAIGLEISVAVVKLPGGKTVRFPIAKERDSGAETGVVSFTLICAGKRVALSDGGERPPYDIPFTGHEGRPH